MPLPQRKNIRLKGFDYSQNGAYFVTVCLKPRLPLFGHVVDAGSVPAHVELSPLGQMVERYLCAIPAHYPQVSLDAHIVMPDHIHLLLSILADTPSRAGQCPAPTDHPQSSAVGAAHLGRPPSLPKIINALKSLTSRTAGHPLWQRGYYEHAIRNQQDFDEAAAYIQGNPARWAESYPIP